MAFQPKNVIIYQWINDKFPERSIQEKIQIFKDLNVDTIFRGLWYCPESHCPKTDITIHYYADEEWSEMQSQISQIHTELPNVKIIVGADPRVNQTNLKNYTTGQIYNSSTAITPESMYVDPMKWGITSPTKEEARIIISDLGAGDLTNPAFYQIHLSRFKKYIDIGCDGIWFDWIYRTTKFLYQWTNFNINHQSVIESYNASTNFIADIKQYFIDNNKTPIIIAGRPPYYYPTNLPDLDIVTEVLTDESDILGDINYANWDTKLNLIRQHYPNQPIITFIDDFPPAISAFSQCLTKEQKKAKLIDIVNLCKDKQMIFAYPVHGMWIMYQPSCPVTIKQSFGLYNYYDAQAPEFYTYDTIKELMNPSNPSSSSGLLLFLLGIGTLGYVIFRKK